jgi:L-2-hydroxyglutarate oxidase
VAESNFSVVIIGGGLLGTSIAYFLAGCAKRPESIALVEREPDIAMHTSSRNTGKVHAPFLYDPATKKTFAKAAALGYDMWLKFAQDSDLVFRKDGVLEVATDDGAIDRLHKYMDWGEANGLSKNELVFLDKRDAEKLEPNVKCTAAIYCSKDGAVEYGLMARRLIQNAISFGCKIFLGTSVTRIPTKEDTGSNQVRLSSGQTLSAEIIVNAAGGNSVDIAHSMGEAREYTDLHFRGEYWEAPEEYNNLTRLSIYSVPRHPDYPFLDPHWIVRADGRREVGPNAVPVFGPYAYTWSKNLADLIPKVVESSRTGAARAVLDRKFLSLASSELKSSLSKTAMINRVREFLPRLRPSAFTRRGTSGIRSSVVDRHGRFVPDTVVLYRSGSVHILNYNSPGATGALPMAAKIAGKLLQEGFVKAADKIQTLWDPIQVSLEMT